MKRKLPPMSALEDAISRTFGNTGFALRLTLTWALVLAPFAVAAALFVRAHPELDVKNLPPTVMAGAAVLIAMAVLAILSINVNWHRRLLLNETPRGLAWIRLNGPVWRYLFHLIFIAMVMTALIGLPIAGFIHWKPLLQDRLGPLLPALTIAGGAILAIAAQVCLYRLSFKLPATSIGRRDYGFAKAWRDSRGNTLRFMGFSFWLYFSVAICAAIGAAAFFAQGLIHNPLSPAAAIGLIAILSWLYVFLLFTIAASLYSFFGENRDFPESV